MIPTSDEYQRVVQAPHTSKARVDVLYNDIVIMSLPVHDGQVQTDRNANIVRRFECKVSDPDGSLTPAGIRDLLAPFGTVLKLFRGVEIPHIERAVRIDTSQSDFNAGTRSGTRGADDGSLVLGL